MNGYTVQLRVLLRPKVSKLLEVGASMLIYRIAVFACAVALSGVALGQVPKMPKMDTGEECIDWFLSSWSVLDDRYAVVGLAENAHSNGVYGQIEWFEIGFSDLVTRERVVYCEMRKASANVSESSLGIPWTKTLRKETAATRKLYGMVGTRLEPLQEIEPPVFDSNGKRISGYNMGNHPPNAFSLAIITGAGLTLSHESGCNYFVKRFSERKFLEQGNDADGNYSVFCYDALNGLDLVLHREHAMPIYCRGYFRDQAKKGQPDRSFFPSLNFESKTQWECLEDGKTYVPVKVDNFVHRLNPLKGKQTQHVLVNVAYRTVGVTSELVSEDSLSLYRNDEGPLADLRRQLFEKLGQRIAEDKMKKK